MISVYGNLTDNEVNIRKQENFQRYNRLIQWGRKHPTRFIEKILGIQLLDYQKWIVMGTWTAEKAAWVCSRNAGKTFLGAVYLMTKAILFPQFKINIMNVSGRQSFDTFMKIEDIAKKNIASLLNTTDVFLMNLSKAMRTPMDLLIVKRAMNAICIMARRLELSWVSQKLLSVFVRILTIMTKRVKYPKPFLI